MRRLAVPVVAGLTAFSTVAALAAAPASAASAGTGAAVPPKAAPASVTAVGSALEQAFETATHQAGGVIGGVRAGSLHTGTAAGRTWAIASFTAAKSASEESAASLQDGDSSGVFTESHGVWKLVDAGLYGCADGLPVALKSAWHLDAPASVCSDSAATVAAQRAAAQKALAAQPAAARAAAAKASAAMSAKGDAAAGTSSPSAAATDPADLPAAITSIALSQAGHEVTPALSGFTVDCDPYTTFVAGFSADSNGCGIDPEYNVRDENEEWCADFNKWVWEQAGVTQDMNTLNAGAISFYDWAQDAGQDPQPDTGTPVAGDSIVFYAPGEFPTDADHVGIVSSVSSDGTIDMVNGDFTATPATHVEYDTDITNLTTWAGEVWGPGEEWLIVAPPTTAQQPTPTGTLHAPSVAVAGTAGSFSATGAESGGSISSFYWTFGDGRTTNTTGADVTHTFTGAGMYTVTVTITSSFGTVTTLTKNVEVLAPATAVGDQPLDAIYFLTTPVYQYDFTRTSGGGLAVNIWDGGSWLQLSAPGTPAATGNITVLSYPEAANADDTSPHAYYRAADGSLAETYQTTTGWSAQDLPGTPAAGAEITATTTADGDPAVFFISASGKLTETSLSGTTWTARTLSGGAGIKPSSLSLADTVAGPVLFGTSPAGGIRVISEVRGTWLAQGIPARTGRGGSLSAVTTPDGAPAVFFTTGSFTAGGHLAEAVASGPGARRWKVTTLPGRPARGTSLTASAYLLPSAGSGSVATSGAPATVLGQEAFYLTSSGAPEVTYFNGSSWSTATLPGTAASIVGLDAYQVGTQPTELFTADSSGTVSEDISGGTNGDPSASWTTTALPDSPATWADQIVLYAADPTDAAAAQAAAAAAGIPAGNVITSFSTAWSDLLSGEYLVFSVGLPAMDALYYNVCGWADPSQYGAGSTPFYYVLGPINSLPGADVYVDAVSDTAADTQALATDLAYYAVNGTLPAGVTASSLPPAEGPEYACAGSPS